MMQKNTKKKIAPVIITVIVVAYVAPLLGMVAYAAGLAGTQGAGAAVPFLLLYALVGGAVIVGVVYAMAQRLREIDGGEEDEASKY
jgi:zinc transporter ZupT